MSSAEVPLLDEEAILFGEEDDYIVYKKYNHPYVVFFYLMFQGAPVFIYLLYGIIDSFILSFVLVVLFQSVDFWYVKNISGRLLVGLRWWNCIDDDGKSHWVFESKKGRINANEAGVFWLALILFPVLWFFFLILRLIGLDIKWILLVGIVLALQIANLYGYMLCYFGANQAWNSAAREFVRKQVFKNAVDLITRPTQPPSTFRPSGII